MFIQQPVKYAPLIILFLLTTGCASLPTTLSKAELKEPDTSHTHLRHYTETLAQQHPGQSGFLALPDGIDALAARLTIIDDAETSLNIQYYIWHDDEVGRALHYKLLQAADRGVIIHLLLDDLDTKGKDTILAMLNHHPNIEVRLFNPFPNRQARWLDFLSSGARLNHRMHNKAIIADRSVAIIGGRNIGNEYFNASIDVGFSDMDTIAIGPVAHEIENSFKLYWNSEWSYPLESVVTSIEISEASYQEFRQLSRGNWESAKQSKYSQALETHWREHFLTFDHSRINWGAWQLFYDLPEKIIAEKLEKKTHIAPNLLTLMDQAKTDLVIVSPYFVPGKEFTRYLVNKVESGTRVRILTNSLASNDVSLVHAGYRRYRKDLVKGGVELYEYKPKAKPTDQKVKHKWTGSSRASLHGKYLGFDKTHVFIGSFNLDGRSVALNTEIAVLFESEIYGKILSERFEEYLKTRAYFIQIDDNDDLVWVTEEKSQPARYNHEPETSGWTRFWNRFFSLVVPESQL